MAAAIKIQAFSGDRPNGDLRGGEPTDPHATVKLPGMDKGLEVDPAHEDQIAFVLAFGHDINQLLDAMVPDVQTPFGHPNIGVFVMDSDGHA